MGPDRYETPYIGPIEAMAAYDPKRQIGQAAATPASCPTGPPWWLLALAAVVGGMVGAGMTKRQGRRRRGRIA